MIINNEQLSRLSINFNEIIEHPVENLRLSANRFLGTNSTAESKENPETIELIKNTYKAINALLELRPDTLLNTDIDFNLYAQLIRQVIHWSQHEKSGYECNEKTALLAQLGAFSSYAKSSLEQNEKTESEKKIEAFSADELLRFKTPKKKRSVLLILTDEQKSLTGYESKGVKDFIMNLPGFKWLRENGITFKKHRTSANACRDARGVINTGQHSTITGLDQTDGVAKNASHPDIRALPPQIPTLGSYFGAAKYDRIYLGKQHFAHADKIGVNKEGKTEVLATKEVNKSEPNRDVENQYKRDNPLGEYGYPGWVGPDPHGSDPNNTAFNKDQDYTRQWKEWLNNRAQSGTVAPFFAAISLVNPHDIVYYPFAWLYFIWKFGFPSPSSDVTNLPINLPPSMSDDRSEKPSIQEQYFQQYSQTFAGPFVNGSYSGPGKEKNPFNIWYQRFYLYFQKLADQEVQKIIAETTKLYPDTIIAVTSDHGDMNGAHGLLQKWHSAYREEIEVPLIISHPDLVHKGKEYHGLSSHADLLPTLLKLAGLNQEELAQELQKTHSEVHPPVGKPIGDKKDYSHLNTAQVKILDSVFFTTRDRPFNDGDTRSLLAQVLNIPAFLTHKITGVHGNTKIEQVEAILEINGEKGHYVYTTYSPDPKAKSPKKTGPSLEEEFYILDKDPYERKNYIHDKKLSEKDRLALEHMKKLLASEIKTNLRQPNDPHLHDKPEHKQLVPKYTYGNDLLLLLLAPPALLLCLMGYLAYKKSDKLIKSAPLLTTALATFGLYSYSQKRKAITAEVREDIDVKPSRLE